MKTAYTCFCTDVIHEGHLNIVNEAKKYGRVIIGALSDKALIRYNKFPTVSQEERVKLYRSLDGVDEVVIQDDMLYDDVISLIKPELRAGLVSSAIYPDDPNWSFEKIHDYCYERGFTIYPGKISTTNTFRLCSLGAIDETDIKDFFIVFKEALINTGVKIPVQYN